MPGAELDHGGRHAGRARPARSSGLLPWALAAADELGLAVFPLRCCGKVPAGRGSWQDRATRDPDQLERWFTGPRACNIGIDTGAGDLLVIDLDDGHGQPPPPRWAPAQHGRDVLARLAEEAGEPVPTATWTVATPSGGLHLYFRQPAGACLRNSQARLGWRIDTRGHGGYIVGAGSRRADGRSYLPVCEAPIAPLPAWLSDLLTPPPPSPPGPPVQLDPGRVAAYVRAAVAAECAAAAAAVTGSRHQALLRAARKLGELVGAEVLDERAASEALRAAVGHHIGVDGCTQREVATTIRDGLAYGRARPRNLTGAGGAP